MKKASPQSVSESLLSDIQFQYGMCYCGVCHNNDFDLCGAERECANRLWLSERMKNMLNIMTIYGYIFLRSFSLAICVSKSANLVGIGMWLSLSVISKAIIQDVSSEIPLPIETNTGFMFS